MVVTYTRHMVLNENQKKAVNAIDGPVMVMAGPGTGKTQVLTVRIANILAKTDTDPSAILALTFTEAATREMRQRLINLIGKDGYSVRTTTFHAFCSDIINENPERFSRPAGSQVATELEKIEIITQILENGTFILLKPLNNPTLYLKDILGAISDLKREGITDKKYARLVRALSEDFQVEGPSLKKTAFGEKERLVKKNLDLLTIYKQYQRELGKRGRFDFEDMINWVVEAFESDEEFLLTYQEKFQYILVDEYQDTNSAQNRLIFALASFWGESANLFVVGDPNQCLPGNTKIVTKSGEKEIKNIKPGDQVLSAVGKGYTSYINVTNIFRQIKKVKQITFTTSSGKHVTVTNNHKMFCFIPPRKVTEYWYNYLMFKDSVGWRLGITKSLSVRLKTESGADKIVGIACHDTESEARCFETIYSLKYQIPTIVFQARGGKVDSKYIDKVFSEFDTVSNAHRLASDLGINLYEPHYMRDATTLGKGRIKINLMMCSRSYRSVYNKVGFLDHPEILHEINIQTSNKEVLSKIESMGFKLRNKNIGKGFRLTSIDIKHLYRIAEKLEKELPGFIDIKSSIGTSEIQHRPSRIMQAGNVLKGSYLPVLNGFEIKYEEIISRDEKIKEETVYDLEVTPSHNFIANGIVVHNSIFRFQGASQENVKQFDKHFPKGVKIILTENYRSTQTLLFSAASLIEETPLKENTNHEPHPIRVAQFNSSVFEDEYLVCSIKEKIESGIDPGDIAIIVKENKDVDHLVDLMKQRSLPYRLQGGTNILTTPLVSQFIKILRVVVSLSGSLDDLELFTVFNYPYFGLDKFELLKLARQAYTNRQSLLDTLLCHFEDPEYPRGTDRSGGILFDEEINKIFDLFITWSHKSASHTLPEMFQIIFQESGLLNYILALPQPVSELNRFNALYEDVKNQVAANPRLDLTGYVRNLTTMEDHGVKLEEEILVGDTPAVTLTTAHKAKGLEWLIVYIYRFADTHWGNKSGRQMIKLPDSILDSDLTKDDKNAEERRLFYVALTRAKREVHLSGATSYASSVKMIFPAMFLSDLPPEHLENIQTDTFEKDAVKILANILGIPSEPTIHAGEETYLKELIANFKLSPTALNTFLQCHYKFKLDNLYRIPRAKAPAMCFGTAVHYALENLYKKLNQTGKLEKVSDFIRDFETALDREVLTKAESKDRLVHGRKILSAYYDHYQHEFVPVLFTERNFGHATPILLDDIALSGKSDRIDIVDKKNKTVRFIDYKTGAPKTRGVLEKEGDGPDGNYKRQLTFYHLLANLDKSFGYKVTDTVLDFIEPDKAGVFHREHFSISPAEVDDLKKVIKDSVKEIRAMNFERTTDTSICSRCDFKRHCWPNGISNSPQNDS